MDVLDQDEPANAHLVKVGEEHLAQLMREAGWVWPPAAPGDPGDPTDDRRAVVTLERIETEEKVDPVVVENAALKRRLELEETARAIGVHPGAIGDFVGRVERELKHMPCADDPTAPHASLAEYVEVLRSTAPHLFSPKRSATQGDPW